MPRTSRLLMPEQATVYHVMSRSALPGLPLSDAEKDHLTWLIKRLSPLYFTEILGFCCMGNHFHILVRMLPEEGNKGQAKYVKKWGRKFSALRLIRCV